MSGETFDHGRGSCRRGGPHEEHGGDTRERRFERCGDGDIAFDDLDATWERRSVGPARECADRRAGAQKLVDDEASDASCCAGHEDGITRCVHHETEQSSGGRRRGSAEGF